MRRGGWSLARGIACSAIALAAVVFTAGGCGSEQKGETLGQQAQALTTYKLSIPLPPGVPLASIALGANGALRINDRAVTPSPPVAAGIVNLGTTTSNIGADSRVGSVWSVPSVTLRNRARVEGDLRTGGTVIPNADSVVTGRTVEHAVLTPPAKAEWSVAYPDSNSGPVMLEPNTQRTLVPGSYGALSVKAGATLSLSAGTYFFTSAGVESQGRLSVTTTNGPLVVYVRDSFFFRGTTLDRQGRADILVGYLGSGGAAIETPFIGTFVAPWAPVTLSGGTHQGAFYAKELEVRPDAFVTHKRFSALPPALCTGAANGTACNDGNACTTVDRCDKGLCVGSSPVVCPSTGNACVKSFCDPNDGQCLKAVANGVACDDGNPSTTGETCLAGNCQPPPGTNQKLCLAQDELAGNLRADPTAPARALELEKGTQIYLKQQRLRPESLAFTNVTTIPVVVHVLEHPSVPAVTDQDIANMLEGLNQRYRQVTAGIRSTFAGVASSVPLVFELASRTPACGATTGIERVATTVEEFVLPGLSLCSAKDWTIAAKGGAAAWDPTKYLNIWIVQMTNDFVVGAATFPNQAGQSCDGFFIQPIRVKTDAVVPPHEIGHYFNLLHTETPNDQLKDMCKGVTTATCATEGDLICDTPATTESANRCALDLNTCTDSPTDLPDQIENYMYSTTTSCRTLFTAEQVLRLEESLSTTRIGLLGSDGFVPPVASPLGDLWSRDGQGDEGQEPNDLEVAWASDDIWIRRQVDDKQQHEDAVYRPGNPNHVYVRVRNRGCQAAEGKAVTLRWAKASTNLGWPAPWDGSQTLPGTSAPMGNVIGTQAVGTLGPGESTVLDFAWEPPNPQDYASIGADATHFCLLSHIGEPSTAPQDLATLVRSSNDVAWKNVTVAADSTALDAAGMMEGGSDGSPQQMRISEPDLPGTPGSVFKWGDVTVNLGPTLFARWVEGGSQASGAVSVTGTSVTLSQATTLQHILLRAKERAVFHVKFAPAAASSAPNRTIADVYRLDVTQLTEAVTPARALGGIRFLLKTRRPLIARRPPDVPK